LVLGLLIVGIAWMMMDETSKKPLQQRFYDFRSALLGGGGLAALAKRHQTDEMNEKGKGIDQDASSDGASSRETGIMTSLPLKGNDASGHRYLPQPDSMVSEMSGTSAISARPTRIPMVREKRLSRTNGHSTLRNSVPSQRSARIE